MNRTARITLAATLVLGWPLAARCGWNDWLDALKQGATSQRETADSGSLQALSESDMAAALRQALEQGVDHAVKQLGRPGGFLDDSRVRIPMPEKLQWVETTLRRLGQDRLADEFVASMNSAAEQAVPEVVDVFGAAIRGMSLADARAILQGPDDAATRYFRRTSSDALMARMRPIVEQATGRAGVTSAYKSMMRRAGGLGSLLGSDGTDLDGYVTRKTLDGLFLMIAEQEKRIRENPVERSTALLRKVFGSLNP